MQFKIPSSELEVGMFVSELDRPWIDTPFLFQGFLIENDEHLTALRKYCKFVLVDSANSTEKAQAAILSYQKATRASGLNHATPEDGEASGSEYPATGKRDVRPAFIPVDVPLTRFRTVIPVEAELAPADKAYARTGEVLRNLVQDIRADKQLALEEVEAVIQDVVDSMVRNPDALMLITRLHEEDEAIYGHGLNVAIYLVALGRHLGLPKELLEHLGTVGLLLDIGKTRLPRELLLKKGRLTMEEFETIKKHVNIGIDILKKTPGLHPDILEGIAQHHERENGSGYPAGISKGDISLFGRMAAIADSFSALTNPRPYAAVSVILCVRGHG